ncbi:flagellar P-ring protein precursor FlgI [Verrucomicrobium sp. GAS474]|uniref:flagellar basal body P-ring protein FlgI n=1 Tax=Verrucomicrobium sp. GAS474 TaxID=1882831 RepID=UPI00087BC94B|nr:flagellar basal body P-ring protein FlgI [Verrucomicrobium sp. GAS474]SDU24632.1 flagellar P-ring protein precursor FlgI [Verrucomicrobium sp. GAS474]
MNLSLKTLAALVLLGALSLGTASAQSRVKDVADVQGNRDNFLYGYGIVSGLAGQGDSDPISTQQVVSNFLKNFGLTITAQNIKAKNSAAVMVTARIGAGLRNGKKFDVVVSSLSDAKSLQGGTLQLTYLIGPDKQVYAQAQGPLSIGGFTLSAGAGAAPGGGAGAEFTKNHPTVGMIPDGAIMEREIPTSYFASGALEISLRAPDFTSAVRLANAVNEQIGPIAEALSSSTVRVFVPKEAQAEDKQLEFIARVENVVFRPDVPARIIMNERTGTIVFTSAIKIDSVAIAHGNLTVQVAQSYDVSQPPPGTGNTAIVNNGNGTITGGGAAAAPAGPGGPVTGAPGAAIATPNVSLNVQEEKKKIIVFNDLATAQDVAAALNALGVTPRDVMAIFQEIKEAGALQADLVVH